MKSRKWRLRCLLAEHFLEELNEIEGAGKVFSPAAREFLKAHYWPGNVRELKNAVHRAFIMGGITLELGATAMTGSSVPAAVQSNASSTGGISISVGTSLAVVERQLIMATLQSFEGNKKKTAETLGVSLKTLYNRLTEYRAESAANLESLR
jgi:two-component system response regulator AtoC